MNIVILNGTPEHRYPEFESYVQKYQVMLHHLGYYIKIYHLHHISFPGGEQQEYLPLESSGFSLKYIMGSIKEANLVVFVSPLIEGHFSEPMQRIQQNISSYFAPEETSIQAMNPELSLPKFGVITMREKNTDDQNLLFNRLSQERTAANLHTLLSFFILTGIKHTEAVFETIRIIKTQQAVPEFIQ
jgi:hypothetical protein